MKKVWMLFVLAVAVAVSAGLTGCEKKEKMPGAEDVKKKAEEAKPAAEEAAEKAEEGAAAEKPKDHPSH